MLSVSHFNPAQYHTSFTFAMDGSGTINPAALNSTASNVPQNYLAQPSPRGRKRSRSPDIYNSLLPGEEGDEDDSKPRKRGRPPKTKGVDSPTMAMQPLTPATPNPVQTPQIKTQFPSQISPTQASPQRTTPTTGGKAPVLKALPTVRDHTTDQLNPEADEYIPRERDDAGEQKVDANGYLTDREYRLRTFTVPNRGQKLFMLATECARVLGYRDSYLLFNKNRSLYKIIANQEEKDNLIAQEVLPYSYRSRQIAIVTARSMFRQFGSRVITNGRRVRDDYWETKARKQGFTEEDAAGEKRPGAAKQREAAAAEAQANSLAALPHGQVVYSNAFAPENHPQVPPGIHPVTFDTLPMINPLSPDQMHQTYAHIPRPRQEITGSAYEDITRESNTSEIATQAASAAEFNKQLTPQRTIRTDYLNDYWKRPHEAPPSPAQSTGGDLATQLPRQQIQSPQQTLGSVSAPHQTMGHQQTHMMGQQGYPHQAQQSNMMAQSPIRSMQQSLPPSAMQQGSPGLGMTPMSGRQQTPTYNYSAGGMWPPPQPQPSPHHMQNFGQHHNPQAQHSPMHPPSQLPRQAGNMGYPQMGNPAAYGQMNRNMYQNPAQQPQFHGQQTQQQQQPGMHAGMQNWNQNQGGMTGQDWQRSFQ
ncbi:chromatin remodelling complex Rsc7/Swp82 subunit-domain-containing protein [Elsinoe ampelina]|uniref:Chromatin remodelling complex Rsc7/Swp82 subunit-domain-containing protein n=1 Tax=Elsinoe ampelina TaxID=302913 RepID=A0A6A6GC39_9PEZI|nr:chromatin remodelling complex Rsc7/Swp82 subunit-domain-containing protein [Elsinoe ampelina]